MAHTITQFIPRTAVFWFALMIVGCAGTSEPLPTDRYKGVAVGSGYEPAVVELSVTGEQASGAVIANSSDRLPLSGWYKHAILEVSTNDPDSHGIISYGLVGGYDSTQDAMVGGLTRGGSFIAPRIDDETNPPETYCVLPIPDAGGSAGFQQFNMVVRPSSGKADGLIILSGSLLSLSGGSAVDSVFLTVTTPSSSFVGDTLFRMGLTAFGVSGRYGIGTLAGRLVGSACGT